MIKPNYLVLFLILISPSFAFISPGIKISAKPKLEALQMEKEGWKPYPGFPPIEAQLDSFYLASGQKDKSNAAVWLMVEGRDSIEVEKGNKYADITEGAMNAAYRNLTDRLQDYLESSPSRKPQEVTTTDVNGDDTVRAITTGTIYAHNGGMKMVKTYHYKYTYVASANHAPNSKMQIDKSAITSADIDMNSLKTFVKVRRTVNNKTELMVKIGYNLRLASDEINSNKNPALQQDSIRSKKFEKFLDSDYYSK